MSNENGNQLYQWNRDEYYDQKQYQDQDMGIYAEHAEMLVNRQYQYKDDGSMKNAKRTTKQSGYMYEVTKALKELDGCLSAEASPNDYYNTVYGDLMKAYRNATMACENYLMNRNPWTAEGKARKEIVKDLYAQIQLEFSQFAELKRDYFEGKSENLTGEEILSKMRTPVYREGEGTSITVEESGGKLTYVIEKEEVKRNFKEIGEGGAESTDVIEKEKVKRNFREIEDRTFDWEGVIKKRANILSADIESGMQQFDNIKMQRSIKRMPLLTTLSNAIKSTYGSGSGSASKILAEKDVEKMLEKIVKSGKKQGVRNIGSLEDAFNEYLSEPKKIKEIEDKIKGLESDLENASSDLLRDELEQLINDEERKLTVRKRMHKDSDIAFILDTLTNMQSSFNQMDGSKKVAKIDENENLAKRNVAASRMANILGLSNIIQESELANIEMRRENKHGVLLDEVQGENLDALKKLDKPEKVSALFNLISLQIFDIICGQVGRSFDNYRVQTDKIIGVNNELSFGKLTYNDIQKEKNKGYNYLQNINVDGQWTIPAIPKSLVISIKNVEPQELNYKLMDLLSKEERDALVDRFSAVKKMILDRLEVEKKMRPYDYSNRIILSEFDLALMTNSEQIFDDYLEKLIKRVQ